MVTSRATSHGTTRGHYRRDEFRRMHGFSRDELSKMRENFEKYAKGKGSIEGTLIGSLLSEVFPWASGKSGREMIAEILRDVAL